MWNDTGSHRENTSDLSMKNLLTKFASWLRKVVSDCRILDLFIAVVSLYNYNSTSLFIKQFTCRNEPIILGFFPPPSLPGVQTNLLKSRCSVWSSLVIPLRISWIWNHSFAYLSSYQIANNKDEPFKFFNTL